VRNVLMNFQDFLSSPCTFQAMTGTERHLLHMNRLLIHAIGLFNIKHTFVNNMKRTRIDDTLRQFAIS